VVVSLETNGGAVAYVVHNFDTGAYLFQSKSFSFQYMLVALVVQLGKANTELKFFSVYINGSIGSLLALYGIGWE